MANPDLLAQITSRIDPNLWSSRCIAQINTSDFGWTHGIVNDAGQPTPGLTDSSWGITVEHCMAQCSRALIPYVFDIQSFAAAATSYFLPWIALTAQLPFETGDFRSNFISFCLAVGSPFLAAYSLSLTILNRYWIGQTFRKLREDAARTSVNDKCHEYERRVRAAEVLLREAQQVPLCFSADGEWLSSLLVIPENLQWWKELERHIRITRRGLSLPLIAQVGLASVAYVLTLWSAFETHLGDPTTALQLAAGNLWIWLIPIVFGWVFVGTQSTHHSVEDALNSQPASKALKTPRLTGVSAVYTLSEDQRGLYVDHDHRWGSGDEQNKGPMYNYAKVFRFFRLAMTVREGLETTIENLRTSKACRGIANDNQQSPEWDPALSTEDNLEGTAKDVSKYTGLEKLEMYPKWMEKGMRQVYWRMLLATGAGLALQWGTTGASILIAYKTPSAGLGCRSASYILYGTFATLVWILLLLANLLSHKAMLRRQVISEGEAAKEKEKSIGDWLICTLAEGLRASGYVFAVLNTIWLIASSLMEFVGFYETCWCKGDVLGRGRQGWIVLFKGAEDLEKAAYLPWGFGIGMALVVSFGSAACFFVVNWKREE